MGFPRGLEVVDTDVILFNCFSPTKWITFFEEREKERLEIWNIQPRYKVQTTTGV